MDDRWRSLDMRDLGLPEDSWPGADTYGSGALSRDGRLWAGHTRGGVVLLDLTSGAVRHVPFPAARSDVRYVGWIPGQDVIAAYADAPESSDYSTFHVDTLGRVTRAHYPAWRTRFDVDGTPVEISGASSRELKVKRWSDDGVTSSTLTPGVEVPRPIRRRAFGVFHTEYVALLAARREWPSRQPAQVWVLDKGTGAMAARLQVPATTALVGWSGDRLRLLLEDRRLVDWELVSGKLRRVLELPGPYPALGEWAGTTVALPSR